MKLIKLCISLQYFVKNSLDFDVSEGGVFKKLGINVARRNSFSVASASGKNT